MMAIRIQNLLEYFLFFRVWFNPESMMNIFSMKDIVAKFRVTMDTGVENSIKVHVGDDQYLKFDQIDSGLYMLNLNKESNHNINKVSSYSLLTLVSANKAAFTNRVIKRADVARDLYRRIGFLGYKRYIAAVRNGCMMNCPITIDNIKRAIHVYGPDVAGLKGKTTRRKPEPIGNRGYSSTTRYI